MRPLLVCILELVRWWNVNFSLTGVGFERPILKRLSFWRRSRPILESFLVDPFLRFGNGRKWYRVSWIRKYHRIKNTTGGKNVSDFPAKKPNFLAPAIQGAGNELPISGDNHCHCGATHACRSVQTPWMARARKLGKFTNFPSRFSGQKTQLSCASHSGSWERTDYFRWQPLPLGCCPCLQIGPDSLNIPCKKTRKIDKFLGPAGPSVSRCNPSGIPGLPVYRYNPSGIPV